ncbi:hypothetical protein SEA_LIZZ_45 [Streptomyces phage Lizz]|nr:hypothetical protein SEA_PHTOWN_45 [Streptomyces phage PHTowN]QNO12862.1 hypothetical protein SEA_SHAKENBAKE_45 [Streptomyces phage ShakeNBake]QYW07592.1 hypothetical protein SEA_LIZZ_45 [Streptomyces phage Lizz]
MAVSGMPHKEECAHLPDPELLRVGGLYWCESCQAYFHIHAFEGYFGAYDRVWRYATKPRMIWFWVTGRVRWREIWRQ